MRKTAVHLALFGILVSGAGLALADEMPPGMKMVPASEPTPKADPRASSHAHMQGMRHGAGEMHDRMKRDHHMAMRDMPQSGMAGMAPSGVRPMQAGRGC